MKRIKAGFTILEILIVTIAVGIIGIIWYKNSVVTNVDTSNSNIPKKLTVQPEQYEPPSTETQITIIPEKETEPSDQPEAVVAPENTATPSNQPTSTTTADVYVKRIGTIDIPAGKNYLQGILNWQNGQTIYKPQLIFIDPNSLGATPTIYPGSVTYIENEYVQSIIKYPIAGTWTAYVKVDNLPKDGVFKYHFLASVDK